MLNPGDAPAYVASPLTIWDSTAVFPPAVALITR